ncbi:LysR substrate-binding domain-containing protein [Cupriavidus sp. 2TAF22]|uniref:LysR substrate-binding domain-containing protein n=1 Tax=unclassified Cupriavidus TaxID=2640874 RepID=UPI003F8D909A
MHWLGWIRFFEAAARHQSFMRAADELHLTHGAVSRQIRQLEDALGVALFERRNRAVFLTEAGHALHAAATQSLELLAGAVDRIRAQSRQKTLVLSCEPTIAMRWLIPRLPRFAEAHPDITLHLMAAGGPLDFARSGVDLALRRDDFRFGAQLHTHEVAEEWVGVVCRAGIANLAGQQRLHTRSRPDAWQRWAQAAGGRHRFGADAWYEHFYLSIQAAAAGLGCAIASRLMVADEMADGRIAAPHGFVRDGSSYHLLSPVAFERDERRRAVRDWLCREALASLGAEPSKVTVPAHRATARGGVARPRRAAGITGRPGAAGDA